MVQHWPLPDRRGDTSSASGVSLPADASTQGYKWGLNKSYGFLLALRSSCDAAWLYYGARENLIRLTHRCYALYDGSAYDISTLRLCDSGAHSVVNSELKPVPGLVVCCTILPTDAGQWQHPRSHNSSLSSNRGYKHLIQCLPYCTVFFCTLPKKTVFIYLCFKY